MEADWFGGRKEGCGCGSVGGKGQSQVRLVGGAVDRVRTGDKQGGKFGLKGHKSAAQHEEDLLRKVQNADSEYASKVSAAQAARQELLSTHRPQAVHNLQQLISECDSGLTLQQQKFGEHGSTKFYRVFD